MNSQTARFVSTLAIILSIWTAAMAQSSGFDPSRLDRGVEPCDDFFQFANGTWLKNTEIPASQSRWGSFQILADNNRDVLMGILDKAAKSNAKPGTDARLIGDYFSACMDEASIEAAGTRPLQPIFSEIAKLRTVNDVKRQVAELHKRGIPAVFRISGGPDLKNSNMIIVTGGQSGLSLPNRDYYTKDDAKSIETRAKFFEYMTNIFKLLGDKPEAASANAATVMAIQTRLAKASLPPVELRDPDKNYNKIPFAEAQKLIPNFSLRDYMKQRGMPAVSEINLSQPGFFREVSSMLTEVSVPDWKTYFRWMTVNAMVNALPKAFVDENFNFQGRYLNGTKEQLPRWKRCVQQTDSTLGEALGMEYVKTRFTPEMKARMDEMITNLFAAMKQHIDDLKWMSPATKQQAHAKLAAYKRKIGYPDKLRGYKGLKVSRASYAGNVLAANEFNVRRNVADINKPSDKTRWGMSPPTVNASYSSVNNDITFPAGILQPPFFNFNADDAINYGGIGAVIGHEITHGFDDQGSKFAADGNLNMWWTKEDRAKFEERAACVVDQFNKYEVQPGLFINGKLTLGENIGDFGGLTIAYDAFKKSMEGKPRPANIDGFTPEQRFFLGWAQVWSVKATPEYDRLQVATDPHSAAKYRVNGPLSNMPQFKQAFGCRTGQPMVREKFCEIW